MTFILMKKKINIKFFLLYYIIVNMFKNLFNIISKFHVFFLFLLFGALLNLSVNFLIKFLIF